MALSAFLPLHDHCYQLGAAAHRGSESRVRPPARVLIPESPDQRVALLSMPLRLH